MIAALLVAGHIFAVESDIGMSHSLLAPAQWLPVEISVYSARYHGGKTASGERYEHYRGMTAATTVRGKRWALPKDSVWEVTYKGRTVTVRVNDVGSHRPRRAPHWLDLNGHSWNQLTRSKPSRVVGKMRRVR